MILVQHYRTVFFNQQIILIFALVIDTVKRYYCVANPFHSAHELAHVKSSDFIYYSLLPPAIIVVSYFLLVGATPCKWPSFNLIGPFTCVCTVLPAHLTRVALPAVFGLGMILYLQVQTTLSWLITPLIVPVALVLFVCRFLYRAQGR